MHCPAYSMELYPLTVLPDLRKEGVQDFTSVCIQFCCPLSQTPLIPTHANPSIMRNSLRLASLALLCAPGVCSVLNTTSPTLCRSRRVSSQYIILLTLPKAQDAKAFSKDTFDFIVVGGGTSGLVVAARLSENPSVRVGVLEAGRYLPGDPNIDVPQGTGYLGNPLYDWGFTSTPQSAVNGRSIYLARSALHPVTFHPNLTMYAGVKWSVDPAQSTRWYSRSISQTELKHSSP